MNDPYSVLGVSRSDSDDRVKTAYKELAVKYAPENYAGNPLSDLAAGKMTEINEAYDLIMSERRLDTRKQVETNAETKAETGKTRFFTVRDFIAANRIDEAETELLKVTSAERGAEWEFLMGQVCSAKGWGDEAFSHYEQAVSLEPSNDEYRRTRDLMANRRRGGTAGNPFGQGGYNQYPNTTMCGGCDPCTTLLCANCLCNCMGGGRGGC